MPKLMQDRIMQYINEVKQIYGVHLKQVILYGSYARGDYREDSDIDIMILLDLNDLEIKKYRRKLSDMTFDFYMDYDMDIKPIAKSQAHFESWVENYPFYSTVKKEGVTLYGAA